MTVHQRAAEWAAWVWPLIANHLWQATLVALIAFAIIALLEKGPGRARYAVWLIASAKFALPSALFAAAFRQLGIDIPHVIASNPERVSTIAVVYQLATPILQFNESVGTGVKVPSRHNEVFCVLTAVWLFVFLVLIAIWFKRLWRFRAAIHFKAQLRGEREARVLARVRLWLGIEREVELRILPRMLEPGVWGIWRPVVLLPENMAAELSDAELEAVLMHEMIHVARWDNLLANLQRFLCCLFWLHPLVWVLDRLLIAERERACDEAVIEISGEREVYASSLLKVIRFCLGWSVAGASR